MHPFSARSAALAAILLCAAGCATAPAEPAAMAPRHRVIVFVWDGMRPDSISTAETPHLAALARRGGYFADNHSSCPGRHRAGQ